MITWWMVYLLNVMFNIVGIAGPICLLSIVFIVLALLFGYLEDAFDVAKPFIKIFLVTFCISSLVLIFVPSKKEALAIYMIPKVVNNQQLQELPDNALKYLNVLFKKEIEELKLEK